MNELIRNIIKIFQQFAFENAQSEKLNVTCQCHFLAKYYEENLDKYKALKVKLELE